MGPRQPPAQAHRGEPRYPEKPPAGQPGQHSRRLDCLQDAEQVRGGREGQYQHAGGDEEGWDARDEEGPGRGVL